MTLNDLDISLKELACDGIAAVGREFVVWTNRGGMDMFHLAMQRTNAIDMLDWLEEKEKISSEQKGNLQLMINSPDLENFNLALLLIDQFKKPNQDGNNIQSR
jgi:hypothetical protein